MAREPLAAAQLDVVVLPEGDRVPAQQTKALAVANGGELRSDGVRIDLVGACASKPSMTAIRVPWPRPVAPSEP